MPKQSSEVTLKGCFLKATGLHERCLREIRDTPPLLEEVVGGAKEGILGCHGLGIELPTSLPASEAAINQNRLLSDED